jgi:hypothetical protein
VQFTAVAFDADNVTVEDAEFTWEAVNGGGNITAAGLFTAGNVSGTFTDTVKVTATADNISRTAFATVVVAALPVTEPPVRLPPGFGHGEKKGWSGGSVPPGWDNGNKTGWGGAGMPPGLSNGGKMGWGVDVDAAASTPAPPNQGKSNGKSQGKGNGKK